jgi:hypothetical protein
MIEICGGSGTLSLNRYWWFNECTYNEYNEKLTNLFILLKDKNTRQALINGIVNMDNSKRFFEYALYHYNNDYKEIENKLEQAILTYTVIFQSFNNEKKTWSSKPISKSLKQNTEKRLYKVADALENIEITQKDCFNLIKEEQENEQLFIYADVPYVHSTRTGSKDSYGNEYEWTDEQHINFIKYAIESNNRIMICNYNNEIYDMLLNSSRWHKINIKNVKSPTPKIDGIKKIKSEYVYINYNNYSKMSKYSINI